MRHQLLITSGILLTSAGLLGVPVAGVAGEVACVVANGALPRDGVVTHQPQELWRAGGDDGEYLRAWSPTPGPTNTATSRSEWRIPHRSYVRCMSTRAIIYRSESSRVVNILRRDFSLSTMYSRQQGASCVRCGLPGRSIVSGTRGTSSPMTGWSWLAITVPARPGIAAGRWWMNSGRPIRKISVWSFAMP